MSSDSLSTMSLSSVLATTLRRFMFVRIVGWLLGLMALWFIEGKIPLFKWIRHSIAVKRIYGHSVNSPGPLRNVENPSLPFFPSPLWSYIPLTATNGEATVLDLWGMWRTPNCHFSQVQWGVLYIPIRDTPHSSNVQDCSLTIACS